MSFVDKAEQLTYLFYVGIGKSLMEIKLLERHIVVAVFPEP